MKAALAVIFFACIAGSMATNPAQVLGEMVAQGQSLINTIVNQVKQQALGLAQQVLGQLSSVVSSLAGRSNPALNIQSLINAALGTLTGVLNNAAAQALGQLNGLLSNVSGLFGGGRGIDLGNIFSEFLQSIQGAATGLGQHLLNQGLAAVLGGLGGARAFNDIFASLSQQFANIVGTAQAAISGVVGNIVQVGSGLLDASKPHWEQLQEQLVGHGLNVLGSLSETINNLHGTITGGR
ncbi:unnamed protein product [Rotaria sordida]|uniref:Uncharacterized protein n=1 Tax=Rotaria sordida TaxID=392033 RepID=A0A815QQZ0_9BILA|nr:unnamed protein product [Rotaria sordida]CAF1643725.1 unnamed protein product [Rotaria sordida]